MARNILVGYVYEPRMNVMRLIERVWKCGF